MNITKHQTDDLNAVIKIELTPEDYKDRVNDVVKRYAKTANVPGFRPGHVPSGMIRKMYGQSIMLEELNKLVTENLSKYIFDQKIEIIGSPLPKKGESEMILEDGRSFEFLYELGLAPQFDVKLPKDKTPYFLLKVEDKMVDDDVNDLRRRYGKFSNPETSEETSILYGEFNELDASGQLKEGGHKTTTTLAIEFVPEVKDRKKFIGLKKEDIVEFNPMNVFRTEAEVAGMLKLGKDHEAMKSDYRFTVMTVSKIEKAELNQEFFDKIYGEGNVTNETEFRQKVKDGIASYFERESDRKLKKDLRNRLLETNSISLPDDFLKRMVKANQDKEMDEATFEHEYYHLVEDLRWNLMQNKIAAEQNIALTEDEVKELSRAMIRQQFAQYGMNDMDPARLEEISVRYLNEEGNYEKLERSLRESKVFDYLKKTVKLDNIELPYAEFVERLNEKTAHELEHHH